MVTHPFKSDWQLNLYSYADAKCFPQIKRFGRENMEPAISECQEKIKSEQQRPDCASALSARPPACVLNLAPDKASAMDWPTSW